MDSSSALARFIRWIMRDTKYHVRYPCTVEGQNGNELELLPDDELIRGDGLSRVPMRHGLPGVTVRVKVGARCLLGFEAGDPRRPYAALWEPHSIEQIRFGDGDAPIAREGDAVTCFWPPVVPITGTVGGQALVGTITITSPAPGIIGSGSVKVRA